MGVGNPTNLELPLHIFTQDLPFSVFVLFMFYFFFCHIIEKSACDPLQCVGHYMSPVNPHKVCFNLNR